MKAKLNQINWSKHYRFAIAGLLIVAFLCFAWFSSSAQSNQILRSFDRKGSDSQHYRIKPKLSIDQQQRVANIVSLVSDRKREAIVALHEDGSVRRWDLTRGIQAGGVVGADIVAVAIQESPQKNSLVVVHQDGRAELHHSDGTVEKLWEKIGNLHLDRDQPPILAAGGQTLLYKNATGRWHVRTRTSHSFELHDAAANSSPTLSPDGSRVSYRTKNGKLVVAPVTSQAGSNQQIEIEGCEDGSEVTAAVFSKTANHLILGDAKGRFCIWSFDEVSAAPKRIFSQPENRRLAGSIRALSFSEDDQHFAVSSKKKVEIWSTRSGSNQPIALVNLKSEPNTILLDKSRDRILSAADLGMIEIHALDNRKRTLVARLISTQRGWAVLDRKGRFDGTQNGVEALAWSGKTQDESQYDLPVNSFFETYYEPGLLAKLDETTEAEYLTEGVADLTESGYALPLEVLIDKIDIKNKKVDEEVTISIRTAKKKYKNQKIEYIRLYRNEKLVAEGRLKRKKKIKFKVRLKAGENRFRAVGINPNGVEGPSSTQVVRIAAVEPIADDLRLVSIAIANYDYKEWLLHYPLNDSKKVISEVQNRSKEVFERIDIKQLVNAEAKKKEIKGQILPESASPSKVLIVYYSGHGYAIKNKDNEWEWYLVAFADWNVAAEQVRKINRKEKRVAEFHKLVRKYSVSSRELMSWLTKTESNQVFLILDACQSGAMVEAFQGLQNSEAVDDAVAQKALQRLGRVGGIHVLAASRAQEVAEELIHDPNGALTYLVLEGVRGKADGAAGETKDGMISVRELMEYSVAEMPYLAQRLRQPPISQIPVAYSKGVDFTLAQF